MESYYQEYYKFVFDDTSSHQHLQAIVTIYCQPNFFNVTERKLSILLNSSEHQ